MYCSVLYCMYCTALYILYCILLYCTVMYCTVLYCTVNVNLESAMITGHGRECSTVEPRLHYCSTVSAISFFLAHSRQMMSSPSVMKPFPTMLDLQELQMKQSLCQCLPSKEMNLVPPIPVIGLLQAVQRLEKSSPKQSAQ